ncbi:MAG TPA: S9 family peptidase [Sphingomicrobium sp.]|nr:S9 family peptidase [Sphingomicrobium sp.]
MYRFLCGGAAAALALCAFSGSAQTRAGGDDLAAAFGARESVENISLSPDGTKVAYIAPRAGQGSALYTVNLADGEPRVAAAVDGNPQRLGRCDWVSNDRLACRIYAMVKADEITPVTRMVSVDADGKDVKVLTQPDDLQQRYANSYGGAILDLQPGAEGTVLMDRWFVPEVGNKTRIFNDKEGYGVVRVDTRTLATKIVEQPVRYGAEFLTDGHGTVRIMGVQLPKGAAGYAGEKVSYSYRTANSNRWQPLGEYDVLSEEGVNPYAVDRALNAVYALKKLNGRQALYRIALDGSLREELVFSHPQVDVDRVLRIGRSRRPVGVSYSTEKRQAVYFDPELKRIAASLSKSMPQLPLINFVDASADESKLLIHASSDNDPGRYFVYDKAKRQLNEIMVTRPQLEGLKLARVKPVNYRASDGTMVPAYLTLPPEGPQKGLPAIVMPHGGPSARDEWQFDWLAQYYASRGYAVLQPNYRGSSGYGDAWFQKNGFQSWKTAIGDVADAGRWLISEGIASADRMAIVGWSYGGYAALQSAAVDPPLFKAVVAIAPVTDLQLLKEETRNWANHLLAAKFIGSGPHLREGSPAHNAARITAPVLMFHGDFDRNVGVTQARRMEGRLRDAGKKVELVVYPRLDHALEDSQARADMLRRSDMFLRSALKM